MMKKALTATCKNTSIGPQGLKSLQLVMDLHMEYRLRTWKPRSDIEEPADGDILTSVDDEIYTKESVETEGMEDLGFARLKIVVDKARSLDPLNFTRATLSPPSSAECKKVPEKPSFKGIVQVRVPSSPYCRPRLILVDGQGYLTISFATAPYANIILFSHDNSSATEI
jgi:hypothetical protein